MDINKKDTALVVIDPQNDVLSEKGVSWGWSARASRKTKPSKIWPVFSRQRRHRASGSSFLPTTFTRPIRPGSSAAPSKK